MYADKERLLGLSEVYTVEAQILLNGGILF